MSLAKRLFNIDAVSDIFNRLDNILEVSVFLNKLESIVVVSDIFNRLDNISEVSLIFNFVLILAFKAFELSIISVLRRVESALILFLKSVTLSPSEDPVAAPNASIRLDKLIVSLPIRLLNMVLVSDIFNLLYNIEEVSDILSKFESMVEVSEILSLLLNITVVSLKFNFNANESAAPEADANPNVSQSIDDVIVSELLVFNLYKLSTD